MTVAADEQHAEEAATMPTGWRLAPLRSVITVAQSGFASGQRDPGGVVQLRMNNVDITGRMNWTNYIRVPSTSEQTEQFRLMPGDVLFNNTNSTELVGKSALFEGHDEPVVFSNHFTRLRTLPEACRPEFLAAWLQLQWNAKTFARLCNRWIGQSAVKPDKLLSLTFPLPPLPEQRRIAAILRERMQSVERARTATEEQFRVARRLPVAELNSLLNALSPYPNRPLPELADFLPAKSIATDGDAEVTAITTACLSELFFDSAGLKRARMHSPDVTDCIVRPGEVLIARSNTPELVGRATLFTGTPSPVVASDLTIRLWARTGINPAYLARFFSCRFVTGYWKERAGGASGSMKKITRGQLLTELVPVPPEAEQGRFADQVASRLRSAQRLLSSLAEQRGNIDLLPAALLREAFRGRF